jgi:hypothetical protein
MKYFTLTLSYNEDQTVSNCIDLGFSTKKTIEIIKDMRLKGVDYLNHKQLNTYR